MIYLIFTLGMIISFFIGFDTGVKFGIKNTVAFIVKFEIFKWTQKEIESLEKVRGL